MTHRISSFFTLFLVSALAFAAPAKNDNDPSRVDPCKLLKADALKKWGFGSNPEALGTVRSMKKEQMGSPSDFQAAICNITNDKDNLPGKAFVVIENFGPSTSKEAIAKWLKAMNDKGKSQNGGGKSVEVIVGDTVCESGEYPVVIKGGDAAVNIHFVACDRQFDQHHVSLNFEWPGESAKLPTPVETKALLDQAIANLPKH
jgi:hypothetical protein